MIHECTSFCLKTKLTLHFPPFCSNLKTEGRDNNTNNIIIPCVQCVHALCNKTFYTGNTTLSVVLYSSIFMSVVCNSQEMNILLI